MFTAGIERQRSHGRIRPAAGSGHATPELDAALSEPRRRENARMSKLYARAGGDPRAALQALERTVTKNKKGESAITSVKPATRHQAIAQIADEIDEAVTLATDYRHDAIGRAARSALHLLGWEMFLMGLSTLEMQRMCEKIAARKGSPERGKRADIIDHAWRRIGSGNDVWLA
jgi:hypothetical protein